MSETLNSNQSLGSLWIIGYSAYLSNDVGRYIPRTYGVLGYFFHHVSTKKRSGRNLAKSQYPEIRFVRKLTFELGRPWSTSEMSRVSLIPRGSVQSGTFSPSPYSKTSGVFYQGPRGGIGSLGRVRTAANIKHGLSETPVFFGRGLECDGIGVDERAQRSQTVCSIWDPLT